MHGVGTIDSGNTIDWGLTSEDYGRWRPNYPDSFYERLRAHNIGVKGQKILDLGTGVGFLARSFAKAGAEVTGTDISDGQIQVAKNYAEAEGTNINFFAAPAEQTELPDHSFDVISASQCWLYFDINRMIQEARRMLKAGGFLVTAHFCWLPRLDAMARATEALILSFNPAWSASDWPGVIPAIPSWAAEDLELRGMFQYDEAIAFSHESWRGRIRACRGVGAALSAERVAEFDAAHAALLKERVPDPFTVLHRIDSHIMAFKE